MRADGQDAVGSQPVQVRRRRLLPEVRRRDAVAVGRRAPRGVRLDAAHRRACAVVRGRVGAPRPDARLPGARGSRPGVMAATRGGRGAGAAVPGRGATRIRRPRRIRDSGHLRQGLSVVLPDRRRPGRLRAVGGHPGRPRPRVGRRLAGRLRAADHRHRPDRTRAAVRALPQSGARVDARHRYRLRRPPPRRDGALRRRQVGTRPGRAGDHVRHHQNQGGAEGFGPDPLRPARFRDRRPDHQGAAARHHGQGHSAVGHHRPHPRAVQGSRRGARPDRRRSRRPHHLRDRPRPGRPDPQRRRARLRGDHELASR